MNAWAQVILAGSGVMGAIALASAAVEFRRLARQVARRGLSVEVVRLPQPMLGNSNSSRPSTPKEGYAIYVYGEGGWELEEDFSAPGYRPATPGLEGAYPGQAIRVASVPVAGR